MYRHFGCCLLDAGAGYKSLHVQTFIIYDIKNIAKIFIAHCSVL